jgi:hypothetical protein
MVVKGKDLKPGDLIRFDSSGKYSLTNWTVTNNEKWSKTSSMYILSLCYTANNQFHVADQLVHGEDKFEIYREKILLGW